LLVVTVIFLAIAWNSSPPNAGMVWVLVFLWAFLPPLSFWYEHYFIYRKYGLPGTFELFKHNQQVSAAIWAGLLAALITIGSSDHFKQADPKAPAAPVANNPPKTEDSSKWQISEYLDALQCLVIVLGGGGFGIRWFFQRQLDGAVDFKVEVAVHRASTNQKGWCAVEVAAVLKNVRPLRVDITEMEWCVRPLGPSDFPGLAGSWLGSDESQAPDRWDNARDSRLERFEARKRRRPKERNMLTRDTRWRHATLLYLPKTELFTLSARCDLGLQEDYQHVRYQSVISTYPSDHPG
jgi:hypothetical protein